MMRNMLRALLATACLAICFTTLTQTASAQNCGFRTSTDDTTWVFSANAGASSTRTLLLSNTTNDIIVVQNTISGSDAFSVTPSMDTIQAGDTASITIVFHPGANATSGTHPTATLNMHRMGMDCTLHLGLYGTVNASNSGSDHTAADSLIADPHEFNFGSIKQDSSACRTVVVFNRSSKTMTVTGWNNCESNQFSISPSFSSNITLAPGDSIVFTICYTPDSAHASASCNLTLHFKVGDSNDDHTRVISFAGSRKASDNNTGGDHNILWSDPREFNFGSVALGHDSCRTVWLINPDSNSTIVITGATHCDGHNFTFSPSNMQDTLAPGQSKQITICYTPDSVHSTSTCSLTINYITLNPTSDGHHLTISFGGSKASNDNNHSSDACMHTEQGSGYHDGVVLGASANRTLRLINPTGASITVTADSLSCSDHEAFSALSSQFPITIAAHSEANFSYTFTPFGVNGNSKNVYEGCVFFTVDGDSINCSIVRGVLIGYGAHDHVDSLPHPMFPNGDKGVLGIEANGVRPTKTFAFQNNLAVPATVSGVTIDQDGNFFEVQSVHPEVLPATIKPGDIFSVTIALVATDGKLHKATLKINADHALAAQEFELQGWNSSAASVKGGMPQGVTINVSPNPMSTNLTVAASGVRNAMVEVYDMLGKQLTSGTMTSTWNWNATANGTKVASGSYIVRITGISDTTEQFVTSKMVIVE
ncbi:MAG TPA: choice-of-anchor D domain-containing protein [Candidatus Kapabacteria bacterium]|nr:choice-of-anchor D domain-containing protein [Candidatus Kapabacteria bacterium]